MGTCRMAGVVGCKRSLAMPPAERAACRLCCLCALRKHLAAPCSYMQYLTECPLCMGISVICNPLIELIVRTIH